MGMNCREDTGPWLTVNKETGSSGFQNQRTEFKRLNGLGMRFFPRVCIRAIIALLIAKPEPRKILAVHKPYRNCASKCVLF